MAVSKRLRFEILRRDDHMCRYCGRNAPGAKLTVDHVMPTALGGSDEASNLVTACVDCNAGKSSVSADQGIVEQVEADALRWSRAMQMAANIRSEKRAQIDAYITEFDENWNTWYWPIKGVDTPFERPTDWRNSIERFYSLGLEADRLKFCVDTAMRARTRNSQFAEFRYMCGVAYNELERRTRLARDLIESDAV